jgi:hypothetical protein
MPFPKDRRRDSSQAQRGPVRTLGEDDRFLKALDKAIAIYGYLLCHAVTRQGGPLEKIRQVLTNDIEAERNECVAKGFDRDRRKSPRFRHAVVKACGKEFVGEDAETLRTRMNH